MADGFIVRWQSEHLQQAFAKLSRDQLPFAVALAATRTAQKVRSNEIAVMRKRFDRPTPWTLRSLYLRAATKAEPEAVVWFKDWAPKGAPAGKYLIPEVYGGPRSTKGLERALAGRGWLRPGQYLVPASAAPLDPYGNVQRRLITQIMSGLRAFSEVGYSANATASRRSRRKGHAERFFVGTVDGTEAIWERRRFGFGVGVRPLFLIVDRAPRYRVRFPFFRVAEHTVKAHYERIFASALAEAIQTAR